MTKLVLHVGAHKTGTSLLQKYMRDNERDLNKQGITYISRGDMNDYIGWGKPLIKSPEKFLTRLSDEAATRPQNIIVASHENTLGKPMVAGKANLYPEAGPRVDALAKIAEHFDTTVIFYIRKQSSFVESYYLQLVHQGSFESFDEWLAHFNHEELSWKPVVRQLESGLGSDGTVIADFDEIRAGQNEFIERFMRRVKQSFDAPIDYKPQRNRSISGKGLAIALAANPHLKSGEERSQMRKFLQKHYSNVDYPRPALLGDDAKARLDDMYRNEFDSLEG